MQHVQGHTGRSIRRLSMKGSAYRTRLDAEQICQLLGREHIPEMGAKRRCVEEIELAVIRAAAAARPSRDTICCGML
jgi:hypothetical protein